MNRPRKPPFFPAKKRKPAPTRGPATGGGGGGRRRSPLDMVPTTSEPAFRVLGTSTDRQSLMTFATPMEMLVIHGFSSEIDRAYQAFKGRPDDFWANNPEFLEQAYKIDGLLAGIVARKSAPKQS